MAPHWQGKKYKMVKSENFDEYMKALGVGLVFRKMGAAWKPSFELIKESDTKYLIRSTSSVKNVDLPFTIDVEFDETTTDGRKVKSTYTFENENKLVQHQKGDVDSTIIREFTETGFVATLTAKDVVCVRTYELE
ncbi:fatty acid-binding protein, muscle-like [Culicoides brevitarsis]|uniref:fatty acid-binding protein, muscle-like n=1 Tax=Culicoides brevitarsis TaxID=469753 RepID=UPI00307C638D